MFASLLSLPLPIAILAFSPQKQKEKTHEALVAWLCAEAQQQAVTYAWEDLHWADPSTLELLTLLLAQVPTTRVLAVLTFRPEFTPPWGSHSYLSQILLSRLSRAQVGLMVEKVTGGKTLPAEVVQQIVSKTDGVPLFVEELTKTVLESVESRESIGTEGKLGQSSLQLGIPATLQDALMARLDRLGAAKEIAQLGATIGREFNYDLLHAVSPLTEEILQQGLQQLVEAELVYQSGRPPQATYLFKHALIQDTAYQSLLKSRRQQLHHQVAQVLVKKFPQTDRDSTGASRASLHRGGAHRASYSLLAAGGRAGHQTPGAQGSDCAPEPGDGDPRHAAAITGARRARTGPAHPAWYGLVGAQRLGSA